MLSLRSVLFGGDALWIDWSEMRFLMFVRRDSSIEFDPQERGQIGPAVEAWVSEMERRKVRLMGAVLAPEHEATTVRARPDGVLVGTGPNAGRDEFIAGFNLIECADLEEAIEVSSLHPMARFGTIELRAIVDE